MYKVRLTMPTATSSQKEAFRGLYEDVCYANNIEPIVKEDGTLKTIGVATNSIEYEVYADRQVNLDEKPALVRTGLFKKTLTKPNVDCSLVGTIHKIQGSYVYLECNEVINAIVAARKLLTDHYGNSYDSIETAQSIIDYIKL